MCDKQDHHMNNIAQVPPLTSSTMQLKLNSVPVCLGLYVQALK